MLKKFFVVFAIVIAVGLILCWIYLPSFSRYHELKQEKEKLNERIQKIDSQIRALADEKYLLQNDVAYLEKVIREELGFVKPGEIIYEMVAPKGAETSPSLAQSSKATVDAATVTSSQKTRPR